MSAQQDNKPARPKAEWTEITPGVSVSSKGVLKIGRSMIMPTDLKTIQHMTHGLFDKLVVEALAVNDQAKQAKKDEKVNNELEALAQKFGKSSADIMAFLEAQKAK